MLRFEIKNDKLIEFDCFLNLSYDFCRMPFGGSDFGQIRQPKVGTDVLFIGRFLVYLQAN